MAPVQMLVQIVAALAGLTLVLLLLVDAFESILQPRRVMHRYRFARLFYRATWRVWQFIAVRVPAGKRRESLLGVFGPLSLLCLFVTWVLGLIFGFALFQWALRTPLRTADPRIDFLTYLYMSGTTFFTLGYGDVTPLGIIGRTLAVVESGLGFAFLAVIIGYLPVLAQAFSKREVTISLLDARAGSPPCAAQFLMRLARAGSIAEINSFLVEWELWSAELLESHLSFPVLSYYRSQHDNQSWLAALTSILDTCAVLMAEVKGYNPYRAQLTFAMARHAAVDLCLILRTRPDAAPPDRLPPAKRVQLEESLRQAGLDLRDDDEAAAKLTELRGMYEPFVHALARQFLLHLPQIISGAEAVDNWQRSSGMRRAPGLVSLPLARTEDDHFG
jgi:Ion channel